MPLLFIFLLSPFIILLVLYVLYFLCSPCLSKRCCSVCDLPPKNLSRRLSLLHVLLCRVCIIFGAVMLLGFLLCCSANYLLSECDYVLTSHEPIKANGIYFLCDCHTPRGFLNWTESLMRFGSPLVSRLSSSSSRVTPVPYLRYDINDMYLLLQT